MPLIPFIISIILFKLYHNNALSLLVYPTKFRRAIQGYRVRIRFFVPPVKLQKQHLRPSCWEPSIYSVCASPAGAHGLPRLTKLR